MFNIICIILIGLILSIFFDYAHYHYLKEVKKDTAMENIEYGFNWVEKYYENK